MATLSSSTKPLRVLLVRIGAMGDVLHALPAVEALRTQMPECFIGWAIEPRWRPLLREGLVDRVHLARTRAWKRRPWSRQTIGGLVALRRELRAEHYDICVDLQGSIRSAWVGYIADAKRFIGSNRPREYPARWTYGERVTVSAPHVAEQAGEMLSRVAGVELTVEGTRFSRFPVEAAALARSVCFSDDIVRSSYAVLVPTAGWGAKQWPSKCYAELALELRKLGLTTLVNAAVEDDPIAGEVARTGAAQVYACGLPGMIEMMRQATVVVGGDTGPVHLAAAMGRPTVALFGPTDPARTGPQGFPGSKVRVLRDPASQTSHKRRVETEAGLRRITVDMVVQAVKEVRLEDGGMRG